MNRVFELSNGKQIPCIGYGTWQIKDEKTAIDVVKKAIIMGYRHIDTAAVYGNEEAVGKGLHAVDIPRENLFITGKLRNTKRGYQNALSEFNNTLDKLGLDYLDLYLIHWPASWHRYADWEQINLDTWKAFAELYHEGKIKAIGVSNFMQHHLEALMKTEIVPMVNQIEFHPGQLQKETLEFCQNHRILVEAWSPLGTGKMLSNALLVNLAAKYDKSVAQICLRWCYQHEVVPLPKSVTPSRMLENLNIFDFEIEEYDMDQIDRIPYFGGSGLHPDEIDF
ncbi:MAG: aldo/keto reductase [Eubacteriales bacterium]|nr:aldo/keto reductase [Eubacteriales bacterium]